MTMNEEKFVIDEKEPVVLVQPKITEEAVALKKWNARFERAELEVGCR